ncbi:uncharacterized protein LACBIDRAFT_312122 [Laccaria bicolor S238N-H82]|uniref:Predicted protein n=1 Tax=Laccaria bicolor (strain S238N-H82 / ATCC MYA-4686) TaxID=486041 RepID=B0CZ47_LACBS|nr:uncharacterized protein LACBIDRAFT_312122 [Laccaria bicolor S238N-H82]EDR13000.1 predicted protein [Laccaria bicolor S238N-H82]|eukprot:XP_001877264.1 predicted protein [Laccaria bicolor S238N-H82]
MFSSPNCSDTVSAPRPSPDRESNSLVINYHNDLSSLVNDPQWWTANFGWLSFTPKRPFFGGGLLGRLADICIEEIEGKYSMPEDLINSWTKLEYIIRSVIVILGGVYEIPSIGPAYPAARGYQRQHAYRSVAHREAQASHDIFVLWIGLLSFLIAGADSLSQKGYEWPSLLENHLQFHPAIADLIWASDLGTFSHEVQRIGAFIYLTKDDIEKTHQPSVRWLIAHNIPIWYQWDVDEIEWAKHDPIFAQFGPLQSGGIPESSANPLGSPATTVKTITWREFFERRDENGPCLLSLETALECERHLNRERNPPIKSAKVFVWDRDPELPGREVLASERIETLEEYGPEQKRYDSYWNEWDCCFEFGRFRTPSPDEMEDEHMDMAPSADQQASEYDIDFIPHEQRCPTPLLDDLYEQTDVPPDIFQDGPQSTIASLISEVQEILTLHYGMVLPDLNQANHKEVSDKEKKFWLRWIGVCEEKKLESVVSHFWPTARGHFFVEFTCQILEGQQIISDLELPKSSSFCERLDSIALYRNSDTDVPAKWLYVFLFNKVTVRWRLAVTTASDVLLVCRLDAQFLDVDIARFLALPILRGGFLWRLTIGSVSIDELLEGPVGGGSLLVVDDRKGYPPLLDDKLTHNEMDWICGMYVCSTGVAKVYSNKSWWPPYNIFDNNNACESYGHWMRCWNQHMLNACKIFVWVQLNLLQYQIGGIISSKDIRKHGNSNL